MHALRCMLGGQAPVWSCFTSGTHHVLSTIGFSRCCAVPKLLHVPARLIVHLAHLGHLGHLQKCLQVSRIRPDLSDLRQGVYTLNNTARVHSGLNGILTSAICRGENIAFHIHETSDQVAHHLSWILVARSTFQKLTPVSLSHARLHGGLLRLGPTCCLCPPCMYPVAGSQQTPNSFSHGYAAIMHGGIFADTSLLSMHWRSPFPAPSM